MKITTVKVDNVEEIGVFTGASVYGIGLLLQLFIQFVHFLVVHVKWQQIKLRRQRIKLLIK